jgi:DNA-binding SARP family transcriptional activator
MRRPPVPPMGTFGQASERSLKAAGRPEAVEDLFDGFPYGLFTVDASRVVRSINEAGRKILPQIADGPVSTPLSCCDLICHRIAEGDKPQCLADEAIANAGPLPEIRVDLGEQNDPDAVWVTVSPLGQDERAVFHLRPGRAGDRRRRTEALWGTTPRLRIFALGPTRVETSLAGSIGGQWIEQRPGQLLKFLVCARGRVADAEEIAQALWPDAGAGALNSVRYFVHVLRTRLEPTREARTPSQFIESRRGGYSFDMRRVWLDVAEFEQLVGAGLAALVAGERAAARQRLERAMNLYRDDFLADEPYAEWALAERNRLRELAIRTLGALLELRLADGDVNAAARYARHLADMEPYDSDAQRRHIELSLRRGRRSEAARRYNLFRRRLMRDFNQEPDFELAELLASHPDQPSSGSAR